MPKNKNEPLDLDEYKEIAETEGKLFKSDALQLIQEIERLREEIRGLKLAEAENFTRSFQAPSIPRCGSGCHNWKPIYGPKDNWGRCLLYELNMNKFDFCSKHPDWKEESDAG